MGVSKLRLTGGRSLWLRKGLDGPQLERLSRHLKSGALKEIALTTNGTRLAEFAGDLAGLGVRWVNVSMDSPQARWLPASASRAAATSSKVIQGEH